MCLEISVEISGVKIKDLDSVYDESLACCGLGLYLATENKAKETVTLTMSAPDNCACMLLKEQATWHDPAWNFTDAGLVQVAKTVSMLQNENRSVVSFETTFLGAEELAHAETAVSLGKLLEFIRTNQLKPGMKYNIAGAA